MSRHARNTLIFSSLTFLSRITGMMRQMAIVAVLDVSRLGDAYLLAYNVPFMLYEFAVGGLLSALFIPVLVRKQQDHGKNSPEAWRTANLLLGTVGIAMGAVSLLVILFAPQATYALTFLTDDPQGSHARDLVEFFVRFFAPQMLFIGINAVLQAILNSHDAFAVTGAAPVLNNIIVIAVIALYWLGFIGNAGLALGTTGGVAAMTVMQLLVLRRLGMPLRPRFNLRDPVFKTLTGLGKPMIAMSGANFLNTTLRANLLYTVSGAFTVFNTSFALIMVPYGIFSVSIATVLFPAMSRAFAAADGAEFSRTVSLGFRWTMLIMTPVAVALALLAEPVVRLLFERGDFSYSDSLVTASFLRVYALSILPYALLVFATRAFYARSDTATPAWISVGGVAVGITLNFALLKALGPKGIALSAVITYTLTTAASLYLLRRALAPEEKRAIGRAALKIALSTAGMAAVIAGSMRLVEPRVETLESGSRFPASIPRRDPRADYVVIRNSESWEGFWKTVTRVAPTPPVDFSRRTVVAFLGAPSRTTTTMELLEVADLESSAPLFRVQVNMPKDRQKIAASLPRDSPTSPPFLLASIRPAAEDVRVEFNFKVIDSPPPGRMARLLQAEGLGRLIALALGGALAFAALAAALRTQELFSITTAFRERLGRRKR